MPEDTSLAPGPLQRHRRPSPTLSETSHLPQHAPSPSPTRSWAPYSEPGVSPLAIQYLPHACPGPQPGATGPTEPPARAEAAWHCWHPWDTGTYRSNGSLPAAGLAAAAPARPRGVTSQPSTCWSPRRPPSPSCFGVKAEDLCYSLLTPTSSCVAPHAGQKLEGFWGWGRKSGVQIMCCDLPLCLDPARLCTAALLQGHGNIAPKRFPCTSAHPRVLIPARADPRICSKDPRLAACRIICPVHAIPPSASSYTGTETIATGTAFKPKYLAFTSPVGSTSVCGSEVLYSHPGRNHHAQNSTFLSTELAPNELSQQRSVSPAGSGCDGPSPAGNERLLRKRWVHGAGIQGTTEDSQWELQCFCSSFVPLLAQPRGKAEPGKLSASLMGHFGSQAPKMI